MHHNTSFQLYFLKSPDLEQGCLSNELCQGHQPGKAFNSPIFLLQTNLEANFLAIIERDIEVLAAGLEVEIGQDEIFPSVAFHHHGGHLLAQGQQG